MKSAEEILKAAGDSPREYHGVSYQKNNKYNVDYMLSHQQLYAGALLKISENLGITINAAAKKYYVSGVSVQDVTDFNVESMMEFFSTTVGEAIDAARSGNPSFIPIDDGSHFVLVALVPNPQDHNKLSVVYVNSMPEAVYHMSFSQVGKGFAKGVCDYITTFASGSGVQLENPEVIDLSCEQQLASCCGLSVISNIASIADSANDQRSVNEMQHFLFNPKTVPEKQELYSTLGHNLFQALDNQTLDLEQPYRAPEQELVKGDEKKVLTQALRIISPDERVQALMEILKTELQKAEVDLNADSTQEKLKIFENRTQEMVAEYDNNTSNLNILQKFIQMVAALFGADIKSAFLKRTDELVTTTKNELIDRYTQRSSCGQDGISR